MSTHNIFFDLLIGHAEDTLDFISSCVSHISELAHARNPAWEMLKEGKCLEQRSVGYFEPLSVDFKQLVVLHDGFSFRCMKEGRKANNVPHFRHCQF